MAVYTVVRAFMDAQDGYRQYNVGDTFPVKGVKVTKARVKSLLTGDNANGHVYLEEVKKDED